MARYSARRPASISAGDVGRRASVADRPAGGVEDRLAGEADGTVDALGVLAQRHDVAERPPALEVFEKLVPAVEVLAGMEQLRDRHAEAGFGGFPRHERVAFGDEGEAQPRIDLPDPVGAGVGHVPEPSLARLDRAGRLASMTQDGIRERTDQDDRDPQRRRNGA